jgi:hypothetical protein
MESNRPASSLLLRVSAVVFAAVMMAAFVWYSQINAQTTVALAWEHAETLMSTSKSGIVSVVPRLSRSKLEKVTPLAVDAKNGCLLVPAKEVDVSDAELLYPGKSWLGPYPFNYLAGWEPTPISGDALHPTVEEFQGSTSLTGFFTMIADAPEEGNLARIREAVKQLFKKEPTVSTTKP